MFENNSIDLLSEKPMEGMEHYAHDFLSSRLIELDEMKGFVDNNDISSIAKMVHKWKGFSAPYGFQTLGELSAQLSDDLKCNRAYDLELFIESVENYLQMKKKLLRL